MSAESKEETGGAASVPGPGWHRIDLGAPGSFARSTGPLIGPLSLSSSLTIRPDATAPLASASLGAVPPGAFVSVGRDPSKASRRRPGVGLRGVANDNRAHEARSVWRDMFFLVLLAATVAGAFWSGRGYGEQRVIVVPGPSSFYSVIT